MSLPSITPPAPGVRAACAVGAVAVTGLCTATLLGLFHQASSTQWLIPTQELVRAADACRALPGRVERLQCTRAVVAAHRDRLARDPVLAQSAP